MVRLASKYPLFALISLTLLLGLGLGVALVWHLPAEHQSILALCRLAWEELVNHMPGWRVLIPLLALIAMLSSGGMVAGRQLLATHRLRVSFQPLLVNPPARIAMLAQQLGLNGRIDVLQSDAHFVFCYGLITPRICVTTSLSNLLEDDELEAVLLHERHHLRSFDPLLVLLCRTFARSLHFLPVARHFLDSYLVAKELAADRHAIEVAGDAAPLASALLKLTSRSRRLDLGEASVSTLNVTRERINQIVEGKSYQTPQPTLCTTFVSLLIVAILFVSSYTPLLASAEEAVFHDNCDPASTIPAPSHQH